MIYITKPGETPQTLQDSLRECPFEELSGWFGDTFDMDVEFIKRDCPTHGKVIDVMYGDEDSESEKDAYYLHMTLPEDEYGCWKQEFINSFVPWLILSCMTSRPISEDFMDTPLRDILAEDLHMTYLEGFWKEGIFMKNIGYEWVENEPGQWEVKKVKL